MPVPPGATTKRKKIASLYSRPLPLDIYPLPAFIPSNPLSYCRVLYSYLSAVLIHQTSQRRQFRGYYSLCTRSVNVTDDATVRTLWREGFFGKGSLSRSEPEWVDRERFTGEQETSTGTSTEVTSKRRQERKEAKRQRAQRDANRVQEQLKLEGKLHADGSGGCDVRTKDNLLEDRSNGSRPRLKTSSAIAANFDQPTEIQEHLQLTSLEAFYLVYGLGVLDVLAYQSTEARRISTLELLHIFCDAVPPKLPGQVSDPAPDDHFLIQYVAYHHYRSLGWVVRPGVKFAVDILLYARGPVFSHAEFAVIVLPSYSRWTNAKNEVARRRPKQWRERNELWYLHSTNRVQGQVLKTLVVAYVEVPQPKSRTAATELDISQLLQGYSIREFVLKRWTTNRNHE